MKGNIKGYKGYAKGLVCHGRQYAENTIFEVAPEEYGVQFCKDPFDVLDSYGFINDKMELNEFTTVAVDDCTTTDNKNYTAKKVNVGEKLSIEELCNECFLRFNHLAADSYGEHLFAASADDYATAHSSRCWSAAVTTGKKSLAANGDDHSAAAATGNKSAASTLGHSSVAASTGIGSAAINACYGSSSVAASTGENSVAESVGCCSVCTTTGEHSLAVADDSGLFSVAASTGVGSVAESAGGSSIAASTGENSIAVSKGEKSVAVNTGLNSSAATEGDRSIAIAAGINSKAKGKLGCYIAVTEWEANIDGKWQLKDIQMRKVDGVKIKEDVYYTLQNGEFVEA